MSGRPTFLRRVETRRRRHGARRVLFDALAVVFGVAAAFHGLAIVVRSIAPEDPPWRHALFVAVNLACAWGIRARPRGFVVLFGAILAQQIVSHGSEVLAAWSDGHRVDVRGLVVVVGMPMIFTLLVADERARRRERAHPPTPHM